jgi:hypothetical protein
MTDTTAEYNAKLIADLLELHESPHVGAAARRRYSAWTTLLTSLTGVVVLGRRDGSVHVALWLGP